jgi:hypothetical protein
VQLQAEFSGVVDFGIADLDFVGLGMRIGAENGDPYRGQLHPPARTGGIEQRLAG